MSKASLLPSRDPSHVNDIMADIALESMFFSLDGDKSGHICFNDMREWFHKHNFDPSHLECALSSFRKTDANGDSQMSIEEFKNFIQHLESRDTFCENIDLKIIAVFFGLLACIVSLLQSIFPKGEKLVDDWWGFVSVFVNLGKLQVVIVVFILCVQERRSKARLVRNTLAKLRHLGTGGNFMTTWRSDSNVSAIETGIV